MPKDWLDPLYGEQVSYDEPIFCQSCGCYVSREDPPQGPEKHCASEVCACHAVYWMTVPENHKRAVWGDR